MASDAQTLMDEVACFACLPPGQVELAKLGLLKQILLASSPMADTSAQALLEAAKCYACLPPGYWQLIELALLQQIVTGGGTGGGSGGVLQTTGNPEGVLVSATANAIAYDCATNKVWVFCGTAGTNTGWQALIG